MPRSPHELHARAVDLVNRGRVTQARRLLADAAAHATDADLRARIAGTTAYAVAVLGDLPAAERMCLEALAIEGIDDTTAAILAGQLGAIAERAGRLDDAERWLARGIRDLDRSGAETVAAANLRINRSLVNMQRRRLAEAADDTRRAAAIFAANAARIDEAQARHNLGYIALLEGEVVSAMQTMAEARPTIVELSPVATAVVDLDRAEVLRDAGLTTESERMLARVAATFGAHRMRQSRAEAEFHLARSLLAHDTREAGRVAAAAARRFRALGSEAWRARADGIRLRARLSVVRQPRSGTNGAPSGRPPSVREIDAAAAELDRHGLGSEAAGLRFALELARAARGEATGGVVRVPRSASMDVRLLAHEVRAARAAARGRHSDARRHAAAGVDELAAWQASFGSLDLKTATTMHATGLIFAGLDSAVRSGRPDVVFEWSERARHLSEMVAPLRPPPDPELAAELAELRMLRAEDPSADWLAGPRAAELRDRARQRQWSHTGAAAIQQRVGIGEVRAALGLDTALAAYVYTGRALAALVVTRNRADVVPLAGWAAARKAFPGLRADLDMAASLRAGPLADVVRRSLDERLATLSAALLDDVVKRAGTRRLVITVPGVLQGIPWAMLPGMHGRAFTLAVSATRWTATSRARTPAVVQTAGFAVGPRVARGDEEVEVAAARWRDPVVLTGARATVDAVAAVAAEVDVLHVAAHGKHAVDNPFFSGLELADGALFGYDVDRMPRVPSTVVLSACEVGRSSVRWEEEAVGMTRIWLHAGTRAVVAAPVVVADDAACELLGAMHAGLAAGSTPAEALAAASDITGVVAPFQVHGNGF